MTMKDVLMMVPAICKKCGGPVLSTGSPLGDGLCIRCARLEAARKMSFSLD